MKGNIIKRNNPDIGIESFRKNMDKLFDDFFFYSPTELFSNEWDPEIDVMEDDKAIRVRADIPGIDEKDLEVKLENNNLVISGEKKEETKDEKKNYIFSERKFGSFCRTISLPEGVNSDKIKAEFRKGVLQIEIPREDIKENKKIKIDVK
jgi:HSP20 family protein